MKILKPYPPYDMLSEYLHYLYPMEPTITEAELAVLRRLEKAEREAEHLPKKEIVINDKP